MARPLDKTHLRECTEELWFYSDAVDGTDDLMREMIAVGELMIVFSPEPKQRLYRHVLTGTGLHEIQVTKILGFTKEVEE